MDNTLEQARFAIVSFLFYSECLFVLLSFICKTESEASLLEEFNQL